MAKSGSELVFEVNTLTDTMTMLHSRIHLKIYYDWEVVSQSVPDNSSTVKWTLRSELEVAEENADRYFYFLTGTDKYGDNRMYLRYWYDGKGTYDVDQRIYSGTNDYQLIIPVGEATLDTSYITIPHDTDSFQTFSVWLQYESLNIGFYSAPSAGSVRWYESHGTHKVSITLDYIVRMAYLDGVSNTNILDYEDLTIYYQNPAGNLATDIRAGMSLTNSDSNMAVPYRAINKVATSYTFSLTSEEKATLYREVLDKKLTTAKLRIFLKSTVPVLDGTKTETATVYTDIAITFVDYKPTLNVTMRDTSLRALAVTGDERIFIRGVSEIEYNLNAEARKGATLSRTFFGNGDVELNTMSGYLSEPSSDKFYAFADDNRGYHIYEDIVIGQGKWTEYRWIPYFPLTCKATPDMLDANGEIDITLSGKYYQGTFGTVNNSMKMQYSIVEHNSETESWSAVQSIEPTVDEDGNYTYQFTITGLDYKKRYRFSVHVIDGVMTDSVLSTTILSATPVFDWGKDDFAFHVPVTINGDDVPSITAQGTFGSWTYRKWSDGDAECWARVSFNTPVTTALGSLFTSGLIASSNLTFPFEFIEVPCIQATLSSQAAAAWVMASSNTQDAQKTGMTQTGRYQIVRATELSNGAFTINYYVRGRWK